MLDYADSFNAGSYRKTVTPFTCKDCEATWEVHGSAENGFWSPDREDDERCPECRSWNTDSELA